LKQLEISSVSITINHSSLHRDPTVTSMERVQMTDQLIKTAL